VKNGNRSPEEHFNQFKDKQCSYPKISIFVLVRDPVPLKNKKVKINKKVSDLRGGTTFLIKY
jgi:hypothetical protein